MSDTRPSALRKHSFHVFFARAGRAGRATHGGRDGIRCIRGELLGQRYPLVPKFAEPEFARLIARVHCGEGFTGIEAERQRKDGSMIPVRMHSTPLRYADGDVIGGLAMLEDLTHSRSLERQKMEAIGRLAGGVAHDFNNLLAVILGMTR